jgi:hypothetical protein
LASGKTAWRSEISLVPEERVAVEEGRQNLGRARFLALRTIFLRVPDPKGV